MFHYLLVLKIGRNLFAAVYFIAVIPNGLAQPISFTAGELIYRQGVLPSGDPLQGQREAGTTVQGKMAACVNCHRRSGLGSAEGRFVIPPIIGKYLFRSSVRNVEDLDMPHVAGVNATRAPYTDESLARAIREGTRPDGSQLGYLMPRFTLDNETMASLIGYLKELTSGPTPGVTEDTLQFATIVTPDADPIKRQGMLDVLEKFFFDKNKFIRGDSPKMVASRQMMYRVTRKWQLHVWQLTGPPETWELQLHNRLQAEPVFAIISGLGGKTWAPIHQFCEHASIPCLLPNTDLPVVAEKDFYSIYFSKGVILEAELIAKFLRERRQSLLPTRIIQIFREGDIGEAAASAVRNAAPVGGTEFVQISLKENQLQVALIQAFNAARPGDKLMLWLRPKELAALPPMPPKEVEIFISGLLGGLESLPLPLPWRKVIRMTYPLDLPDLRRVRMNYPLNWFRIQNIPVVDEHLQSDTYLACVILAETLGHMLDSFIRDYFVERAELMFSYRLINGYYPRLSLASDQRFASKGGYIVHFADTLERRVVADSDWIVP